MATAEPTATSPDTKSLTRPPPNFEMSVQTSRTDSLEESEIFHILGNDRRRAIVRLLAETEAEMDVSNVASSIAEAETDASTVPSNLYKSVYVSLQQTHLPQLQEDDVIEYDPEMKTIEQGSQFADVLRYTDGNEDDTNLLLIHLGIGLVGLALITLADTGMPIVSTVDTGLWGVLALVLISLSSLYHILR